VFYKQFSWPYNENYYHRKRYQRHIADVSIISDIIISALQIELQWLCCKFFSWRWLLLAIFEHG